MYLISGYSAGSRPEIHSVCPPLSFREFVWSFSKVQSFPRKGPARTASFHFQIHLEHLKFALWAISLRRCSDSRRELASIERDYICRIDCRRYSPLSRVTRAWSTHTEAKRALGSTGISYDSKQWATYLSASTRLIYRALRSLELGHSMSDLEFQ